MKTKALIALLLLSMAVKSQSISNSVINSTGQSYSRGYYSIDWSVGELSLVNSMETSNGIVIITNGFLQPGMPNIGDSNARRHFTADEIRILPNPTYDKIEINIATSQLGTIAIMVYDANGRALVSTKTISNGIRRSVKIDLSPFPSSTYFLAIELNPSTGSVKKTGSYKIVKL